MSMTCNINRSGKILRFCYGVALLLGGVLLAIFWARGSGHVWEWLLCIALALGGAFAMFEAAVGWCAIRAMGFKTSI
jgi:hypothetical protein